MIRTFKRLYTDINWTLQDNNSQQLEVLKERTWLRQVSKAAALCARRRDWEFELLHTTHKAHPAHSLKRLGGQMTLASLFLFQSGIWKEYISSPRRPEALAVYQNSPLSLVTWRWVGGWSSPGDVHKSKSTWLLHGLYLPKSNPERQEGTAAQRHTVQKIVWDTKTVIFQKQVYRNKNKPSPLYL